MTTADQAKRTQLVRELIGGTCRCGRAKKRGKTFCRACYSALPTALRRRTHLCVGKGYEEAYAEAAAILDAKGGGS